MLGLYTKLIAVAVAAAVFFGAGWTVNSWRLGKQIEARENELLAQAVAAQKKYAADIQARDAAAARAVQSFQGIQDQLNARISALKEKLKHGNFVAPPGATGSGTQSTCDHPFTIDLPRALNGLSDAAEGRDLPAAAPGEAGPAGAPEAAAPTSEVTGDTLAEWYAEIMRAYAQCKIQLDAIREWDKK